MVEGRTRRRRRQESRLSQDPATRRTHLNRTAFYASRARIYAQAAARSGTVGTLGRLSRASAASRSPQPERSSTARQPAARPARASRVARIQIECAVTVQKNRAACCVAHALC